MWVLFYLLTRSVSAIEECGYSSYEQCTQTYDGIFQAVVHHNTHSVTLAHSHSLQDAPKLGHAVHQLRVGVLSPRDATLLKVRRVYIGLVTLGYI